MIEIQEYNASWEVCYKLLEQILKDNLKGNILRVEHVGSTSVKGLCAKPILDINVVIENHTIFPEVVAALSVIGYYHQEDWSFDGREAFGRKDNFVPWSASKVKQIWMDHHLYVCTKDSEELTRHLAFRDYLRSNEKEAADYGKLKLCLARTSKTRQAYTSGKSEFVTRILKKAFRSKI
ncbi:GrpB family protein [Niallia circulans]|uniref:GrpB family protein n=1 Tax=Niallia circulans TaxID=1397 RepID=A0A553SSJ9_NIACI|nr:GrpB family protein [Niallia circulans]TRZ39948.1 GrpB family protein [Niallia circulans]